MISCLKSTVTYPTLGRTNLYQSTSLDLLITPLKSVFTLMASAVYDVSFASLSLAAYTPVESSASIIKSTIEITMILFILIKLSFQMFDL